MSTDTEIKRDRGTSDEADRNGVSGSQTQSVGTIDAGAEPFLIVIKPRTGWIGIDWRELKQYRELLFFLIWRDITIRYKQTVLGVAWAILQPIIAMLIFTVIFGRFARFPTDGVPYPLFVLAGLIPWSFFSTSIALAGQSLINQQHLLTKVYFPRLFIPAAGVGAHLVDMAISLGLYAVMMVFFRTPPGIGVLTLPLLIMLTIIATSGIGILLAALTVEYRDFKYVVPFMVQTLLFMSPVVYPSRMVSPTAQVILAFNPMAGIVEGFRSALLGRPWNVTTLAISTVMSFVFFFVGVVYFRRTERYFADIA